MNENLILGQALDGPKQLQQKTILELVEFARNSAIERSDRTLEYANRLLRVQQILEKIPSEDREFLREFFLKNSMFGLNL